LQKILGHRGAVLNSPIAASTRLVRARAHALAAYKVKGAAAHQDFLRIWKDAGPDIAIFKQAKAEFGRLE
jgi:hypothetical protein